MPRVVVGGKVIYLGYLDQSARCLIEEVLRLTGQSFTWDIASDSLFVESSRVAGDSAPAPQARLATTEAPMPSSRIDGSPAVPRPLPDLSQVLTGLLNGTITPSAASAVIGRPITVGYGKVALQVRRDGTGPAQPRPGAPEQPPEFDDPRDAMPPQRGTGRSKRRKGQAGDDGEPWPVTIKPIVNPLGRPLGSVNPRMPRRPHT